MRRDVNVQNTTVHTGRWNSVSMRELLTRTVPGVYSWRPLQSLDQPVQSSTEPSPATRSGACEWSPNRARTNGDGPYDRMQQEVENYANRPLAPAFAHRQRNRTEAVRRTNALQSRTILWPLRGTDPCSGVPGTSARKCALVRTSTDSPRYCTRDSQDHRQLPTVLPQEPGPERWSLALPTSKRRPIAMLFRSGRLAAAATGALESQPSRNCESLDRRRIVLELEGTGPSRRRRLALPTRIR